MDGVVLDCASGAVAVRPLTGAEQTTVEAAQAAATAEQAALDAAAAPDRTTLADLAAQYQGMLDGLDTIRTHMASIQAGPATPTAAQTGTALKLLAGDMTNVADGLERLLKGLRVLVRRAGV